MTGAGAVAVKSLLHPDDFKMPECRAEAERQLYSRAPLPATVLQACREYFNEPRKVPIDAEPLVAGVIA